MARTGGGLLLPTGASLKSLFVEESGQNIGKNHDLPLVEFVYTKA